METCSLCKSIKEDKFRVFIENEHAIAMVIREPQIKGHSLVLPKRHIETMVDLTPEESKSIHCLLEEVCRKLDKVFGSISISILNGFAARSQAHLHYQIFPITSTIGIRELITKTYDVPNHTYPSKEEMKLIADKIKQV
jgi:histidine triad (HIT) family protein